MVKSLFDQILTTKPCFFFFLNKLYLFLQRKKLVKNLLSHFKVCNFKNTSSKMKSQRCCTGNVFIPQVSNLSLVVKYFMLYKKYSQTVLERKIRFGFCDILFTFMCFSVLLLFIHLQKKLFYICRDIFLLCSGARAHLS